MPTGTVEFKPWPCVAVCAAIGAASTGASLTLPTARLKSPLAAAPPRSVAVTRTSRLPTSALAGVPLKLRVAASNRNQAGNALPLARLAA